MATGMPECSPALLLAAGLAVLAIGSYLAAIVVGRGAARYPPVAGTVFHQVYHLRRLHDYYTDLFREHATFRLLAPGRRQIYTSDTAVVEHILRTNFANYGKGASHYDKTSDLFGDGIFTADGDKWRQQRKIASYDFSTRALRDFSGGVFNRDAAKLAHIVSGNAAAKQPMDFQELLMKATMDSIFTIAVGVDLDTLSGSDEGSRFAAALDDASEFTLLRFVNAFWKVSRFLNVGAEAALRRRIEVVDEFMYKRIRARADEISDDGEAHDTVSKDDLLSRFIQASTRDAGEVDYKHLRDMILNIVMAGKDTTAGALAWFLYMMCKHPEVQERISEEAADAGEATSSIDDFSRSLTDEALNKMHYLHAALTETLRLYPSLPLFFKQLAHRGLTVLGSERRRFLELSKAIASSRPRPTEPLLPALKNDTMDATKLRPRIPSAMASPTPSTRVTEAGSEGGSGTVFPGLRRPTQRLTVWWREQAMAGPSVAAASAAAEPWPPMLGNRWASGRSVRRRRQGERRRRGKGTWLPEVGSPAARPAGGVSRPCARWWRSAGDNKECFSDDVLPNGLSVGKGDIVFYAPYAMGRMERLWGEDAIAFRPERWLDERGEFLPESPFKFTAFQAGPRICLGKEFAYREMKIFAAVLLRFFVLALHDKDASVNYRTMITLYIDQGLHLTATARGIV
ncbi:cytochrome P450 704C1 isoform X3 [Triticum aestivum]|uniref:cytochrome P450 704C1 isoform X3 n=1 Tax=Triticum aestivum TaxID=4565 RepID=UPI0008450C67|nr:cytochrome P450 704C1-like isoform X3 [Triticum aestivum]